MSLGLAEGVSARPPGADSRRPSPPPPLAGVVPFVGQILSLTAVDGVFTDRILSTNPAARLAARAPHRHGGPMAITNVRGILAVLAEPALRDELDRVAAAVGVRVVHAGSALPVSRKTWSAAAAVVLDEAAAQGCADIGLPRRAHVIVLTGSEPASPTWAAAIEVGARQVLKMPAQEHDLVRELADAGESARDDGARGEVVAVIGGRGGAGASLFAVALAHAAADPLLVDLDPWG